MKTYRVTARLNYPDGGRAERALVVEAESVDEAHHVARGRLSRLDKDWRGAHYTIQEEQP